MSAPALARPAAAAARARRATHVLPMRTRELIAGLGIVTTGVLVMWLLVVLYDAAAAGAR